MKKVIIIVLAILALLIPVKAKQIIFNESFNNGLESINLSMEGSKIDNIVYWTFVSPFATKQPDTAAIFSYYPSKGYSNVPDRTNPFIRLSSSWQKVNDTLDNWVVFDWQYGASAAPNQSIIIGILARTHPDSAWITLGQIKGNQFSFMSGSQMTDINKMSAKIPANLIAGKDSIQVAAYFNYSTNASLNFILFVDNFSLVSFGDVVEQPRASLTITAPATIFNSSKDIITAKVFNEGALSINKLKLAYTVNGGDIVYREKTLNLAETISPFGKISLAFNPGLVENSGDNHIKVWIAALNETEFSAGEDGDTVSFSVYMPNSTTDKVYPTKFLVEHFTASTCGPCLDYNKEVNPVYKELEEEGSLIYIKYPVNWPGSGDPYYVAADAGVRTKFYNVSGVPSSYGNGDKFESATELRSSVNGFVAKSYFKVEFDSAYISYKNAGEQNLYIKYRIAANVTSEVTIHTVVFEKTTYNNTGTNSETEFPHVTMKMFPDGNGNAFTLKRDSVYEFVYEYNMAETFMERINDLELVVFIQKNDETKEIFHASQQSIGSVAITDKPEIFSSIQQYDSVKITITCPDTEAVIYYSLSGIKPTEDSAVYNGEFWIKKNTTVMAIARKAEIAGSEIVTKKVNVRVLTPEIIEEIQQGDSIKIIITCATPEATIYYNLNSNSKPNALSPVFDNAFWVKPGVKIRAIAIKSGMENSAEATHVVVVAANEDNISILPIKIFPNPANEYVNVEYPENARMFLYNSVGMPIYEGRIKASATKKLSLAGYAKGIYVLKVVSDKGIATEKIIIQ
jgi:thiol-disulfide isomerase/thioredoxin